MKRDPKEFTTLEQKEVGLLIGFNCSATLLPRKVSAEESDPYAVQTLLGWGVTGNMTPLSEQQQNSVKLDPVI